MKSYLFAFGLILSTVLLSAQDLHFSQFYAVPQQNNPAFTGFFKEDIRANAIYKNQWQALGNTYNTIGAGVDAGLLKTKLKGSILGIGLNVFSDKAGDIDFSTNIVNLQLAYTQRLGYNAPSYLSLGFQAGATFRSVDLSKATFGNQFINNGYDNTLPNNENNLFTSYRFINMGLGVLWFYEPTDEVNLYVGAGMFNLLRPNQSFFSGVNEDLYHRYTAQMGAQIKFTDKISAKPAIFFQRQGPFQEMLLGSFITYDLNGGNKNADKLAFSGGLWYRLQDALIPTARLEYKDFNFTLSYDLNISSLTRASNANGGAEISIIYKGWVSKDRQKEASRKFKMSCPVL